MRAAAVLYASRLACPAPARLSLSSARVGARARCEGEGSLRESEREGEQRAQRLLCAKGAE